MGKNLIQLRAAVGKVYGFFLSTTTDFPAEIYSNYDYRIPEDFGGTAETGANGFGVDDLSSLAKTLDKILSGPLPVVPFDTYVTISDLISSNLEDGVYNVLLDETEYGNLFGNLITLGTIHFAPAGPEVDGLIQHFNQSTNLFKNQVFRVHKNEDKAVDYIDKHEDERTWVLISLKHLEEGNVDYTLRFNYTTVPSTNYLISWVSRGLDVRYQRYYLSGFVTIADVVDGYIFNKTGNCTPPEWMSIPFPTAAYDQNIFYTAVGYLLGVTMAMATLYPVSRLIKDLVEEKETRMRMTMAAMGMDLSMNTLARVLTATLLFGMIALCVSGLSAASFLPRSDFSLVLAYFSLLLLSEIALAFLVAACFSRARLASIVGPVVIFASTLPRYIFFGTNRYENTQGKIAASLLSCSAFCFGADILADYEYAEVGVSWDNYDEGEYSMQLCLVMMAVDTVIYSVLAYYLQEVMPSQYGTSRHPLFFLLCLLDWFRSPPSVSVGPQDSRSDAELEEVTGHHDVVVRIDQLTKSYSASRAPAVDRLCLNIYKDQVTCLLGHNGAGKSTTISMITGLTPPTSGDCLVEGHSIVHDMSKVRSHLGVCPQTNVIFPSLTVYEHLSFFAKVKGVPSQEAERVITEQIKDVGLSEKTHAYASSLSGGMKRKLCLAMALIGDVSLLLLDEPTSGMDPYSRRATWELIRRARRGKAIILTTHFMDEADLLGDRIAVMSKGQLRCCGSSLWLKSRYGVGYNLTMVRKQQQTSAGQQSDELWLSDLTAAVARHIPSSELVSVAAREVSFRLPKDRTRAFPALFRELEGRGAELGVDSFGVSMTTLEEVFIRIALEDDQRASASTAPVAIVERPITAEELQATIEMSDLSPRRQLSEQEGFESELLEVHSPTNGVTSKQRRAVQPLKVQMEQVSFIEQVLTTMHKRWVIMKRDRKGMFFQLLLPVIVVGLILGILAVEISPAGPPLLGNPKVYDISSEFFVNGRGLMGNQVSQESIRVASQSSWSKGVVVPRQNHLSTASGDVSVLASTGNTSTTLSQYLLATYNEQIERLGALTFLDEIPANVTVNYDKLDPYIELILSLLAMNGGDEIVEDYLMEQQPIVVDSTNVDFQQTITGVDSLDDLLERLGLNDDTIDQLTNSSVWDDLLDILNISNPFNFSAVNSTDVVVDTNTPTVELTYTGVRLADDGSYLTFYDVDLTFVPVNATTNDTSTVVGIGNLNITSDLLLLFLPGGSQLFQLTVDSDQCVLHNSSSFHGVFVFHGFLRERAYAQCFPSKEPDGVRYKVWNHPLPLTTRQTLEIRALLSILACIFILIALSYAPAAFVTFVVKERSIVAKHIQVVSGLSHAAYWVGTYLWDMVLFLLVSVMILGVFFLYGDEAAQVFLEPMEAALATFLLILLFGWATIAFNYSLSFLFDNHSTAQIAILSVNFVCGFVFVMAVVIMEALPETRKTAKALKDLFRLFPPYNLGEGLINLVTAFYDEQVLGGHSPVFSWDVVGRPVCLMAFECVLYFCATLLADSSVFRRIEHALHRWRVDGLDLSASSNLAAGSETEDVDVAKERLRVSSLFDQAGEELTPVAGDDSVIVLHELHRVYPPPLLRWGETGALKHAVKGLSLSIPHDETFGFLGINGAGKTTTLSMLTGDLRPSAGHALINGEEVLGSSAQRHIGYCPQEDPLLELMTGRETLALYGRLKGIPRWELDRVVENTLERVGLLGHADEMCGGYSGGMKRKLSFAVALIGEPATLLLDEPSTGMDPVARRQMWDAISEASVGRSIVLTTHLMEECEALCTRVGIMVGGRFQCLGSSQHLKNRFFSSYKLEFRCPSSQAMTGQREGLLDGIEKFVQRQFPDATRTERHGNFVAFQAPGASLSLSETFDAVESVREELSIEDYSVSQGSLEQVFIQFAKAQSEETGQIAGLDYQGGSSLSAELTRTDDSDSTLTHPETLEYYMSEVEL